MVLGCPMIKCVFNGIAYWLASFIFLTSAVLGAEASSLLPAPSVYLLTNANGSLYIGHEQGGHEERRGGASASAALFYNSEPNLSAYLTLGRNSYAGAEAELRYGLMLSGNPGPVDISIGYAGNWRFSSLPNASTDPYTHFEANVVLEVWRGTFRSDGFSTMLEEMDSLVSTSTGYPPIAGDSFQRVDKLTLQANTEYYMYLRTGLSAQTSNTFQGTATLWAYLDPVITVNTSGYSLLLSDGVGNVAVSGVPETSTWAMMLLGFCGIGFVACRRRNMLLNAA